MLTYDVTSDRGLVRVSGVVPNGHLEVERNSPGVVPFTLRDGILEITNQGFSLEDSEAPAGVPLTYTATSTPTNRTIQENLVLTPDFSHGVQSWTAGASRTVSSTGVITANPAGTTTGIPGRTIGEVAIPALQPNTTYLFTARIKFTTPAVWTWQDAKNVGTWSALKAAKATWRDVLTSIPSGDALTAVTTVYASLALGTSTFVAPIALYSVPLSNTNQWVDVSAFITAPATIPANARLRLLHGTVTREYALTWQLDQIGLTGNLASLGDYHTLWFSGDSTVPANPEDYLTHDPDWEDVSGDADMFWTGAVGNSISRFISPSVISLSGSCQINPPDTAPCEPVLLSDPVSSALAQWFGLAAIDSVGRDARASFLEVINRTDAINSSSVRGSANGSFTLFTDTLEQRHQAISVFESGRVLLLRNPDPLIPENMWYIGVGNVTEERILPDVRRPERAWTVPFRQVERPKGLIEASSGVHWQQVKDSGLTWGQLRAQRKNWLDVLLTTP